MKTKNNNGQSLTEYLILTALISVGSIAVVQLVSKNIQTKFAVISEAIRGKEKPALVGDKATERHHRTLDMSDFAESATYNDNKK